MGNEFINEWNNGNNKLSSKKENVNESKFYAETTCINNVKNINNETKEIKTDSANQQFFF